MTSGNTAIDNPSLQQGWGLDATGNWQNFTQFDLSGVAVPLDQQRVSNTANEITSISQTVGTAANWVTPSYDRAGNMTTMPQPLAAGSAYVATFDAWQRLMTLTDASTGHTVQKNQYDGRNFRVARLTYTGGSLSETRYFVYSSQWQVLEEYVAATSLTVPDRQYVWGLRYIDDLVLRDRDLTGTLERLYPLQDANWNVVAICNASGAIQERYNYTAYGVSTVLNPDFSVKSGGTAYDWTVLYTGRELDVATGLYYFRRRDYHAVLGVFTSTDPVESDLNTYGYVRNSPTIATDPFGLGPLGPGGEPLGGSQLILVPPGTIDSLARKGCSDQCGPDVTESIRGTLSGLESVFTAKGTAMESTCRALYDPKTAGKAWDIHPLYNLASAEGANRNLLRGYKTLGTGHWCAHGGLQWAMCPGWSPELHPFRKGLKTLLRRRKEVRMETILDTGQVASFVQSAGCQSRPERLDHLEQRKCRDGNDLPKDRGPQASPESRDR